MKGLMIHTPDGHNVGLNEVLAVPVPNATKTYVPVPNEDLIGLVRHRIETLLDMEIESEAYGLSRNDQQMFGVMRVDTGHDARGLSIGLRNSYDYSLSVGFASGASVFVCDNLCFSGSATVIMRKHTRNVWEDVVARVDKAVRESGLHFSVMNEQLDSMKEIEVDDDRGFEIIGRAMGHGILRPHQVTIALKDWKKPRHEQFEDRNLYSLYNCFTEGLKLGPAGTMLSRHTEMHGWFKPMLPEAPELAEA